MPADFDFLDPNDKPALLGLSTPEYVSTAEAVLAELGYKVHAASNHDDFLNRFGQVHYHVVILEQHFAPTSAEMNISLNNIQTMPMALRRHAVFILIGDRYQSLHPLHAYQQSVHNVLHPDELVVLLAQVVQKSVADNNLFLNAYRETQTRIAQGKI